MAARTYSSPRRDADAARTRSAILDAADLLFSRDGYPATTMKAIGDAAGVSVQSVRLAGSKASVLIAAFERAFAGDEGAHSLAERPAMAAIMSRDDPQDAMRGWLDYVTEANTRTAALVRAMAVAAETDDAAAAAVSDLDHRRRRDLTVAAEWFADRRLVNSSQVSVVTDELNYLIGPETFAFFVTRSGWSVDRYRDWLETTLNGLLHRWRSDAAD